MAALKTGHPSTFFSFFYNTYKFISEEVFSIIFDIKYVPFYGSLTVQKSQSKSSLQNNKKIKDVYENEKEEKRAE